MDRMMSRAGCFAGVCGVYGVLAHVAIGVLISVANAQPLSQASQTQQAPVAQQTQPDPHASEPESNAPEGLPKKHAESAERGRDMGSFEGGATAQDTQSPQQIPQQTSQQTPQQIAQQNLPQNLKEGVDYVVLKTPIPNAQNTLIEVYSYACPFCFKYAKILPQIMRTLPESTTLHLYHLDQKGDYGKLASQILAALIIKDRQAGIDILDEQRSAFQRAKNAYFDEYHIQKNRWKDGKDPQGFLRTGLLAAGVSEQELQQALQAPEVRELLEQWQASYNIAIIQGVPAFVVNGKYLIKTSELKSLDDLGEKIQALLTR